MLDDSYLSQGLVQVVFYTFKTLCAQTFNIFKINPFNLKIIRYKRNDRNDGEKRINNHSPNNLIQKIVLSVYF